MTYDDEFWTIYAKKDNPANIQLANFFRDLAVSLRSRSILEVGCSYGNDLSSFLENFQVYGVDLNEFSLEKARKIYSNFVFKKSNATNLPFENSSIDFVFTHKLFNYLDEEEIEPSMTEILRVSKKYVLNCEIFGDVSDTKEGVKKINMQQRWKKFPVRIVSNVEFHEDIDPEKSRFTLIRKL